MEIAPFQCFNIILLKKILQTANFDFFFLKKASFEASNFYNFKLFEQSPKLPEAKRVSPIY